MKLVATVSFLIALPLVVSIALAQVQYYGIDSVLDENGRTKTRMTITFSEPETYFNFSILGRMEKFNATSTANPPACSLKSDGISSVECSLNLTEEKRTIELSFETNDFVRAIQDKSYFDSDLSLSKEIDSVFASVMLPEGTGIVSENFKGRLSYPDNATIISDGRHIIVTWKLSSISSEQPLRFQILYERVNAFQSFQIYLYIGIFAVVAVLTSSFVYIRYFRKSEKLILSVLDDFERRVMDVIVTAGGTINQKKVVQATNLSKAKVSRVVKSLADRGLIEIERLGRTNRLKMIKKKFKFI